MHSQEHLLEAFSENYKELQSYAYMVIESTAAAEDIVQELAIKIVSDPLQFASAENLPAYFRTCIANAAKNTRKREKKTIPLEDETAAYRKRTEAFFAHNIDRDLALDLERILHTYTEEEIKLIELRYLYGYGVQDIAKMQGIKPNAVSQQLFRIRAKLRIDLKREKILFITLLIYLAQRAQ